MKVNNRGRLVLMGVLEDERQWTVQDVSRFDDLPRQQRGRHRLRLAQAQAGLVPIDLARWLGREPTNSERVLFHREYIRLEDLGLLERCNLHGGRRTTHLRLTEAGRHLAENLLADAGPHADCAGETSGAEGGDDDGLPPFDLATIDFLPIEVSDASDNDM